MSQHHRLRRGTSSDLTELREAATSQAERLLPQHPELRRDAVRLFHHMIDNSQRYRGRLVYSRGLLHLAEAFDHDPARPMAQAPQMAARVHRAKRQLIQAGFVLVLPPTGKRSTPTHVLHPRPGDTAATMTTADPRQPLTPPQTVAHVLAVLGSTP